MAPSVHDPIPDPAGRIVDIEIDAGGTQLRIRFKYRDLRGVDREGSGRVYLPPAQVGRPPLLPTLFVAGYPVEEPDVVGHLDRGYALVTTDLPAEGAAWPGSHPLMRGPNLDLALLHIARSLPFVDNRRLAISGVSAGGWMALLLAAETFPLASVMPDVPIINWAYEATYFLHNHELTRHGVPDEVPQMSVWADFADVVGTCSQALGDDTTTDTWRSLSPLAQLDTITCQVSAVFSTADILVPIDQVGCDLAQPFDTARFHPGFTRHPDALGTSRNIRQTLLERVRIDRRTVEHIPVPKDATRLHIESPPEDGAWRQVAVPHATTQWAIGVIDEGPPDPEVAHFKYALNLSRDHMVARYLGRTDDPRQLTRTKLERLIDRYRGEEWLPCGLVRLDYPEAERADVLRGLAGLAASLDGQVRLLHLYSQLDADRQVLGTGFAELQPDQVPGSLASLIP